MEDETVASGPPGPRGRRGAKGNTGEKGVPGSDFSPGKSKGIEKETLVVSTEDGMVVTGSRIEALESRLMASIRRPLVLIFGLIFLLFITIGGAGLLLDGLSDTVENSDRILREATGPETQAAQLKAVEKLLDEVDCRDQRNLQKLVTGLIESGFVSLSKLQDSLVEKDCEDELVTTTTVSPTSIQTTTTAVKKIVTKHTINYDARADCESGDRTKEGFPILGTANWQANTGNGYYGGLQFDHSTWVEFGGLQYSENAHLTSRENQIAVASKTPITRWPTCKKYG